jgi:hypothetical protein
VASAKRRNSRVAELRGAPARSTGLITRRSRVQIPPPLLERPWKQGLFDGETENGDRNFCPTFARPPQERSGARPESAHSAGVVALTGEEARALNARLEGAESARSAGGTLAVSTNASTSVTFTEAEKAAVLDVLVEWLGPASDVGESAGLAKLQDALARDLGKS